MWLTLVDFGCRKAEVLLALLFEICCLCILVEVLLALLFEICCHATEKEGAKRQTLGTQNVLCSLFKRSRKRRSCYVCWMQEVSSQVLRWCALGRVWECWWFLHMPVMSQKAAWDRDGRYEWLYHGPGGWNSGATRSVERSDKKTLQKWLKARTPSKLRRETVQ